jgi:alpha-tubulin suppressor-like RCC1 family protein
MILPHGISKVVDFSAGEEHSALLSEKGEVFTWGYGNDGQLGHKERTNLTQPKKLTFDKPISKVICGGGHTGIITEDNTLYLFGRGRDGQLGRGDAIESVAAFRTEPKEVTTFSKSNSNVVDVALGSNHSIALAAKRI